MSGVTAVALGAILFAVFLGIVAVMVWQEAQKRRVAAEPVYVLEDAVSFVTALLDGSHELRTGDVRRILEWEVHYLQLRARGGAKRGGIDVIAGGTDQAVEYIRERTLAKQGKEYSEDQVRAVLAGEAAYLRSIGAVGEEVGEVTT
jgi:hypothetical protein